MSKDRVYIFDTTLRDGAQTAGIEFSLEDKISITGLIEELGVDYVEGGYPGANPVDTEFFERKRTKRATFTAFGMTKRAGRSVANDPGVQALLNSQAEATCFVAKTWDHQVNVALEISLEENLENVRETVAAAIAAGKEALIDCEHFFDGFKANPAYALACVETALVAGARWVVLCDTNGGTMPSEVRDIVAKVLTVAPGDHLGIHAHDDTGQAVANTLAAVEAGVRHIQGTLNGIGERCGNANLVTIIPTLVLKPAFASRFATGIDATRLVRLTQLSRVFDDRLNRAPLRQAPYVGASAFATKAGIHASALLKDFSTYEHVQPESVGNERSIMVSQQAGKSNLLTALARHGIELAKDDRRLEKLLATVKERESCGYSYDGADASFAVLAHEVLGTLPGYFTVENYRASVERRHNAQGDEITVTEAVVKIRVGGELLMSVAEGNGPVNALDLAMRKDLGKYSSRIEDLELVDFKVRILDGGTGAVTRVLVESRDGTGERWCTIGVSPNIIDASFEALYESITYKLLKTEVAQGRQNSWLNWAESRSLEDKLAETAPKQPLALTLGAAAVTIAVIIGVLAGPSVATCFNSSDGMGLCLRGKMVGVGILPEPATALVDPGETPATVTPDTALAEPAPDVTAPQPGVDVPENLVAATFGLLRVEPDGSVVITGSGTPGSEVEIYSNGALLGKAEVGSSGDWVLLPDAPIPPGGTEITLVEAGKSGVAEQTFIVAVNEDKISQPLVVASTPGAAREVLQGLALPAQLAAADPAVSPAEPRTVATEPAPMGATASAKEAAPETATATPAQPPASSETPAKLLTAPEAAPAAATQMAVAAVEPAPTTSAMVLDGTLATIDAIEIEGGKTFFAGSGPEGAAMRLYVDDLFIADTTVSDQRWLIEAGDVLNKPSQRIRVDVLQPESTKVASRAEVNFVVDLPVDAVPVAITQIEQPVMPASDSALSQPIEVVPAQQPATASVAPTEATAALAMAATAEPTAAAMPSGADAPALGSTAAGTSTAVASVPTEPTELDTSAETPPATTSDVPTLVATSVSDPDAARFASGKAIIRRGDNLWTIASRVYGEGIKYTTIYQANTGQIRDPDRIYPGQVFDLPESTD